MEQLPEAAKAQKKVTEDSHRGHREKTSSSPRRRGSSPEKFRRSALHARWLFEKK
jgi:hypothetical protein